MIGKVLGNYRVVSRIGAGGMGTIYLAEHQLLGSRAAIKVLLPEMSEQRRIVERFFDEARAATRIQDPGIVTVLDFGWHEGCAYLVMEYLVGETLADRLRRTTRLPVVESMRLAQHCAIAMAAAHARGIVHRDLKPDNIFIVADPAVIGGERIKILDFGIAKLIDDEDKSHARTKTGVIMGTPAFMSPEQCRGAGGVDHRTDIYALGCVLFNMLCGRPPFIAGTAGDLLASHLREPPPRPSALVPVLTPEVDAIVLRCLAKEADERYASMTELARVVGSISGENLALETIPPRKAITPVPVEPVAVAPRETLATGAPNTTLRHSAGEAATVRPPPWRGGLIIVASVIIVVAVITFALTRAPESEKPRATTPPVPTDVAQPVDAAVDAPMDAAIVAAPIDAAPPAHASPKKRPPVAKPDAGVMKPVGSGSAKYDPYENR